MTTYTIKQYTGYQWEPIPDGEFDSLELAEAAISILKKTLGWDNLRVCWD